MITLQCSYLSFQKELPLVNAVIKLQGFDLIDDILYLIISNSSSTKDISFAYFATVLSCVSNSGTVGKNQKILIEFHFSITKNSNHHKTDLLIICVRTTPLLFLHF